MDGTLVSLSWTQPGYLWGNPPVLPLAPWLKRWKAQPGDSLLVQIVAEEEGPHRLTFHPQAGRDEGRVAERSAALAEAAYEVLQRTVNEVSLHELALRLLARGVYHDPCPPDSLGKVLLWQDDRFTSGFLGVRLADKWERLRRRVLREKGALQSAPEEAEMDLYSSRAAIDLPLFDLFGESESFAPWAEEPLSPEQKRELARQVYCFKASLEYRKGLWRRIEVRGDQTMGEFDGIMRDAFDHDLGDHLSEFYLAGVRDWRHRGLGTLGPWGYEGSGEDVILGAIGLEEGDELRYIYDFGDDIGHILQLEKILPAEEGVQYPRLVEQNKPRYQYCESCQARGQQTIATWLCIECSNEQGREVLVCEKCLEKKHEDHWADEMIY
jgi:hypothetical protein